MPRRSPRRWWIRGERCRACSYGESRSRRGCICCSTRHFCTSCPSMRSPGRCSWPGSSSPCISRCSWERRSHNRDWSRSPSESWWPRGVLAGSRSVEDHVRLLQSDQPATNHLTEIGQNGPNRIIGFDDLDDQRQVDRKPQHFVRVHLAGRPKTSDATQDRRPREPLAAKALEQRLIKGLAVVLVVFADEDPHQRALAAELFCHRDLTGVCCRAPFRASRRPHSREWSRSCRAPRAGSRRR